MDQGGCSLLLSKYCLGAHKTCCCVTEVRLTEGQSHICLDAEHEPFPQQLATSLFSFLYHLASYESGCEALVASGLIESLLKVVLWPGKDDHITVCLLDSIYFVINIRCC